MRFGGRRFKGRPRHTPGRMNKLEARYGEYLEGKKRSGEILDYWFEAIKFRLADKTFYTPDFLVMAKNLTLEIHEVKGFWEDDAKVKIKVAAERFPFAFMGVMLEGPRWKFEEF